MTKTNTTLENMTTERQNSDLAPSLTLAQFHDDVTNVFLHYVRNISWMTDVDTAWAQAVSTSVIQLMLRT